jgi:hypothetical protein
MGNEGSAQIKPLTREFKTHCKVNVGLNNDKATPPSNLGGI